MFLSLSKVFICWLIPCTIMLVFSCSSSDDTISLPDGDVENESEDYQPSEIEAFYMELRDSAWSYPIESGDWTLDFGDAAYYGLAYYINAGTSESREDYIARATEVKDRNITIINDSKDDFVGFIDNLEELMMAELGLIEYMYVTGDTAPLATVDEFLDLANDTLTSFGTYIELDIGSYALSTYGPTTIAGVLVLINLRYAEMLDTPRKQERIDFAEGIMVTINEKAFMGNYYRFNSDTEALYLYPNIMMMLSHCIAYKLTEKEAYKTRSLLLYQAIQDLKDPEGNRYHSPYSAKHMGATTDNYTTLSSMNYTILALMMLIEITEDTSYLSEIESIILFVRDYLYEPEEGRILHHWMDGRVALPEDPEFYCSGCNFQFLYALWYLQNRMDVKP